MRKTTSKFATFLDQKYIPLDNKIKIAIAVVLVIIPIALFYFLYFQPSSEKIATLTQQNDKLSQEIKALENKKRNLPKLQKEIAAVEERFEEAKKMLPSDQEIPQLLKDISALGQNAGLDFLSFIPRPEVPKDFYNDIPVDINVRGPYHSVGFFFDQVSKLDRIVSVNNVNMGGPQKVQGEMLLNSRCQLVTYRFTNVKISDQTKK